MTVDLFALIVLLTISESIHRSELMSLENKIIKKLTAVNFHAS